MFECLARHVSDPAGAVARFGGAVAVTTMIDMPLFNPILALDAGVTADDVVRAHAHARQLGVHPGVLVRTDRVPRLRPAIDELLLQQVDAEPVLALEPLPHHQVEAPPELRLRTLGPEQLDAWYEVTSWPAARRIFNASLAADDEVRLVIGTVDQRPVAAAAAFGSRRTLGIYAVDTIESARRRGYGRAVTQAAIDAGRQAWGATLAVLQSTSAGLPLYRSMGFVEIGRYELYAGA